MAKLTYVYRSNENDINILPRQIPVVAGDNLVMLMDLNSKGLCIDSPLIRGKELEEFTRKFNLLTDEELRQSLEIDGNTLIGVLNQCVQCVGCRRRVEMLFQSLSMSGYPTLYPLVLKNTSILTVTDEKMKTPQALGTILYRHHEVLNNLLENKLRNKTRCVLHSMDSFRTKPFSETWREVWSSMKNNCRDELAVIETKELHEVLENYLKKHKFCQGCRTKIEKAYKILVGETTSKEKGYVASLYSNIKKCQQEKHIHVVTNKLDFLEQLIRRAEPEVNGSYSKQRERHAKTLEIAQEEVLTCVGILMYERLRRVYVSLREEDRACQVLAAVGVHALCRSFDTFVEKKQGISNLELLYQEISRAEKAKEQKRELKKLKKKMKKNEKKNLYHNCCIEVEEELCDMAEADDDDEPDETVSISGEDEGVEMALAEHIDVGELLTIKTDVSDRNIKDHRMTPTHEITKKSSLKKKKLQKQANQKQSLQKKNKKKQKQLQHEEQTSSTRSSSCSGNISEDRMMPSSTAREPVESAVEVPNKCNDCCLTPTLNCPCENDVKDSGYGSEAPSQVNSQISSLHSSPEGSEVSCSDGFCNHEHEHGNVILQDSEDEPTFLQCAGEHCDISCQQHLSALSLQQMLEDYEYSELDIDDLFIPLDVLQEYQFKKDKVQQLRKELRETLKQNFERLCKNYSGCS